MKREKKTTKKDKEEKKSLGIDWDNWVEKMKDELTELTAELIELTQKRKEISIRMKEIEKALKQREEGQRSFF